MRARAWRSDESGASLAMVLIFITVVAVVVGAVLSFADVNFRTTTILRQQSESASAAEAAGQIAVNALRNSIYAGSGDCLGSADTLPLPDTFYESPASGQKTSAAVKCVFDDDLSVSDGGIPITGANKPARAILNVSSFNGLSFTPNSHTIRVNGSIYSNGNIDIQGPGKVRATGAVGARGFCDPDVESTPPPDCFHPLTPDFSYTHYPNPSPAGFTGTPALPSCTGSGSFRKLNFLAGRYTGAATLAALNNLTKPSGCNNAIFAFEPGNYYFDFDGEWNIQTGYVVAGDPVGLVAGIEPKAPGSCKVPAPPNPVPAGGVVAQNPAAPAGSTFLLGREARIKVSNGASFEVCGPYSAIRPPIAIFGVENSIPSVIREQDDCIIFGTCSAIVTEENANFIVQGMVYLPQANVDIRINPPRVQTISSGIIARSLDLTANGDVSYPVAQLPGTSAGVGLRTVVVLRVYVCPGQTSCGTTGTARLEAKVALTDAGGVPVQGARTVTILNWNVLR